MTTVTAPPRATVEPNIFDGSGLASIKRLSHNHDPSAIKPVAQQFEALFIQMMLKSMRDATPHEDMLNSDQQRMYESLLDQQLSQVMAAHGGGTGLAAVIEKQMKQKTPDLAAENKGIALNPTARALPVDQPDRSFAIIPAINKPFAVNAGQ